MPQPSQHWHSQTYHENARFVSDYGASLIKLLAPQPGERILDIGCGDGALTAQLAATGAEIVGIDGSAEFVRSAQAKGINAQQMDAQTMPFRAEFDALFSNAALHWMPRAVDVAAGMAQALKPNGRIVLEFGGISNVQSIRAALAAAACAEEERLQEIWYFPSAEDYQTLLSQHGLHATLCYTYPRPTPLPTGIRGWLDTFAAPLLSHMSPEKAQRILSTASEALEQVLPRNHDNKMLADYVRLRVVAQKSPSTFGYPQADQKAT